MKHSFKRRLKYPQKDFFLIVSNVGLLLFTLVFILIANSYYKNIIEDITLNENRFITTEWRLLQELRSQTDQKLLEKEQEIAELNRRYLKLIQGNAPSWELEKINTRLNKAKKERKEILSRQRAEIVDQSKTQKTWFKGLIPPDSEPALISFYKTRIKILKSKLEEAQNNIIKTENIFPIKNGEYEKLRQEYSEFLKEFKSIKEDINNKISNINNAAPPSIENINTRSLVRALLNSQATRAQYPDLLNSFDNYFENFGIQKQIVGQRDAYKDIIKTLDNLMQIDTD